MPRPETDALLQIVRFSENQSGGLHDLLSAVLAGGEDDHFRPHPFDRAHLDALARNPGRDLYFVATIDTDVAAYGLLRGWNEGYETPSLGIAVHPDFRGKGVGVALMHFLHSAARLRGSTRVRLRVASTNPGAIRLYEKTGYRFEPGAEIDDGGQALLVAYKDL